MNHELPDLRHEWEDDERDDIGFGIPEPWGSNPEVPTVASVRMAANKAVKIAVLLLGEKVDDKTIEEQARDFMSLSREAMDRTLARFAATQKLYAEDEGDEGEQKEADDDGAAEKEASKDLAEGKKAEAGKAEAAKAPAAAGGKTAEAKPAAGKAPAPKTEAKK